MGRLTDNYDYCFLTCYEQEGDLYGEECPWYKNCHERQIFERLKHYEDLEEQGRLICLPCKVGDTFFRIYNNEVEEWKMVEALALLVARDFGKTVFLTKEEALAKLEELKGE